MNGFKPKHRRKNTLLARRIAEQVIALGFYFPGGPENAWIRRTYAGCNQKSAGAFLWTLETIDDQLLSASAIGSTDRAQSIGRAKRLSVNRPSGDIELFAENP